MFRAELDLFAQSCKSGKSTNSAQATACRARGGLRGAAVDRGARPRHRLAEVIEAGAGPPRRKEPQCCLAGFSRT